MNKFYMKTAPDSEIIMEFVKTHCRIAVDTNLLGRPLVSFHKRLKSLEEEMLRRGLLTQEQIDKLNM